MVGRGMAGVDRQGSAWRGPARFGKARIIKHYAEGERSEEEEATG